MIASKIWIVWYEVIGETSIDPVRVTVVANSSGDAYEEAYRDLSERELALGLPISADLATNRGPS